MDGTPAFSAARTRQFESIPHTAHRLNRLEAFVGVDDGRVERTLYGGVQALFALCGHIHTVPGVG
jgi:hypothetical protein